MSDAALYAGPLERIATGIDGLDVILHGGFLRGGIYMVSGDPGSGKTIFANQMCFHHVRAGERVLYITLLAENHSRIFSNLRELAFFDPGPIGETLLYFSGYGALRNDGLSGLSNFLRQSIRQYRASLVVIDGLETAVDVAESSLALKRFIHELHVYVEAMNATLILLAQLDPNVCPPIHAMADGVIELYDRQHDLRAVRELTVQKLRGSDYVRGRHLFNINARGIVVHPRTEALPASTTATGAHSLERLQTGVVRLDEMLEGGLLPESTTMLLGTPGSGKTVLGLHVLAAGARAGEQGLYFGSTEKPARLVQKATRIGLSFDGWVEQGLIEVVWQPPREPILDVLAERVLDAVRRRGVRRLFIDGIDAFEAAVYPERLPAFFAALTNQLNMLGVTTVIAVEMRELFGPTVEFPSQNFSANIDNIIFLRYVELRSQLYRLLSILKIRDSGYDPAIREFKITDQGLDVAATFESAEAILTGLARPLPADAGLITPNKRPRRSS
jgi:circadian clock protein KaiC